MPGGLGLGSGTPASLLEEARLCQEAKRQPPALPMPFLSPHVLGDLGAAQGCGLGGGNSTVPHAPSSVLALSPQVGSCGCSPPRPGLCCSWASPFLPPPGGCIALQAGRGRCLAAGEHGPHHTPPHRDRVAPAAPKRDWGGWV